MRYAVPITTFLLAAVLAGCGPDGPAPQTGSAPERLDEAAFRASVVGRRLTDKRRFEQRYSEGGAVSGDFHGRVISGRWVWREGRLCRTIRAADKAYSEQCLIVRRVGEAISFEGTGANASDLWRVEG